MPDKLVTSYRRDMALMSSRWHWIGLAIAAAIALIYPFYVGQKWMTVGNIALVAVVGSVSLMILTGFCGQISLGHAAFLALGAYTTAVLGSRWGLPYWLLIPAAGAVAAVVGVAVGFFALRLKGLYLAIVTIGLIVIVHHAILSLPSLTNGLSGISVPVISWFGGDPAAFYEPVAIAGVELTAERKLYFIFLIVATLVVLAASNLGRSSAGRAMMAVRDHDLAASALGVNPARTKVAAFAVSSFFAGVTGALFAMQQQYITADPFNLVMSIEYIAMIVLGGIGSIYGAVAGALVFTMLRPLAETVGSKLPLIEKLSSAQQSTVLFTAIIVVFLIAEPLGLAGIWMRIKRYFLTWPFRY
jgi:branched-chain amino acid transport system permease protein